MHIIGALPRFAHTGALLVCLFASACAKRTLGETCSSSQDCDTYCPYFECTGDEEEGLVCAYGVCRYPCTSPLCASSLYEARCSSFGSCAMPYDRICYPPPDAKPEVGESCGYGRELQCETDFNCPGELYCERGYCRATCSDNSDCANGQLCETTTTRNIRLCTYRDDFIGLATIETAPSCALDDCPDCQFSAASCDPASGDGCGPCGRCIERYLEAELTTTCVPRCSRLAEHRVCATVDDGACDPALGACVPACSYENEHTCTEPPMPPSDGGVEPEPELDPTLPPGSYCGGGGACSSSGGMVEGGTCETSAECNGTAICLGPHLRQEGLLAHLCAPFDCDRWTRPFCTLTGCDAPGGFCPGDMVCATPSFAHAAACLPRCRPLQALEGSGATTHAPGCREGFACAPTGASDGAGPIGVCVPGTFNGAASNIGDRCIADGDCYSPLGLGRCTDDVVTREIAGRRTEPGAGAPLCTVPFCALPSAPATICPSGFRCVDGPDGSLCAKPCATASECGAGGACVEGLCQSQCASDEQCREGERCVLSGLVGACASRGEK